MLAEKRYVVYFLKPCVTPPMMTNGSHKHLVKDIQRKSVLLTVVKLYRSVYLMQ
jgi:hypothetical protein